MLLRSICLAFAGLIWLFGWCGYLSLWAQTTPPTQTHLAPWFWRRGGLDVVATARFMPADHSLRLAIMLDRRQLPYAPHPDGQWRTSATLTLTVLDSAGVVLWPLAEDSWALQEVLTDTLPADMAAHVHDLRTVDVVCKLPPQLSLPVWGWVRLVLRTLDGRQAHTVMPYSHDARGGAQAMPDGKNGKVGTWCCGLDADWAGNFFQSKNSRRPVLWPPEAHCTQSCAGAGPLLSLGLWRLSGNPAQWSPHWHWPPTTQSGPLLDSLAADAMALFVQDRLWAKLLEKHGHAAAPLAYWQRVTGQSAAAQSLWAEWRRRVQVANVAFAEALPSLRTDRALAWLLLGPPDAITWHPEYVLWFYEGRGTEPQGPLAGALQLMFRAQVVMPGVLHYDLVRQPTLEPLWYAAIDHWRRGLRFLNTSER